MRPRIPHLCRVRMSGAPTPSSAGVTLALEALHPLGQYQQRTRLPDRTPIPTTCHAAVCCPHVLLCVGLDVHQCCCAAKATRHILNQAGSGLWEVCRQRNSNMRRTPQHTTAGQTLSAPAPTCTDPICVMRRRILLASAVALHKPAVCACLVVSGMHSCYYCCWCCGSSSLCLLLAACVSHLQRHCHAVNDSNGVLKLLGLQAPRISVILHPEVVEALPTPL